MRTAQRLQAGDVDVVLMRQDPPFDLSYITATHLLERLEGQTLVVNDPASVRNAPEKVFVLDYAHFMPPTLIARRIEDVKDFHARHPGDLVMKPLHGNGGKAVVRIPADGSNLGALIELFDNAWVEPHMFQPFLPEISEGDKRIVLVDGVALTGAIRQAWRSRVAYVQQDPVLLAASLRENLCWAAPDADDARLTAALDVG